MFLHSGASLHGHEYSTRPSPSSQNHLGRRSPLLRHSLVTPITRASTVTDHHRPPFTPPHRTPSAPTKPAVRPPRPLSEHIPRMDHIVRFIEPTMTTEPSDPISPRKPSTDMSEDEGLSVSELSDSSQTPKPDRKRRRQPRKSTAFLLAHPAPKLGAKARLMQGKPKLLLQLQQLSAERRPRPALDVLPSSIMPGLGIANRLVNRFPRGLRGNGQLGTHDVLLVKSEDYDLDSDDEKEEDSMERRELVAILSPLRREDRAEIVMADGNTWFCTPRPNGSFEFVHTDPVTGHLTTARWVRRSAAKQPANGNSPGPSPSSSPSPEFKYTFSIINPLSRRHPIMASLTSSALEIFDSYTTVSSSSGKHPPTIHSRSFTPAPSDDDDSGIGIPVRAVMSVDDNLKAIISVTAVWVALRNGWSPFYRLPNPAGPSSAASAAATTAILADRVPTPGPATPRAAGHRGRSLSIGTGEVRNLRSTPESTNMTTPSGISGLRDRIRPRRDQSPGGHSVKSFSLSPRRATSTGAAFMQKKIRQSAGPNHSANTSDAGEVDGVSTTQNGSGSVKRRVLSGEWNIPCRRRPESLTIPHDGGVKLNDMREQSPGQGGVRLGLDPGLMKHDENGRAKANIDGLPAIHVGGFNTPGASSQSSISTTSHARWQRARERRSLPLGFTMGFTNDSESNVKPANGEARVIPGLESTGGALVASPDELDHPGLEYFSQSQGGVSLGTGIEWRRSIRSEARRSVGPMGGISSNLDKAGRVGTGSVGIVGGGIMIDLPDEKKRGKWKSLTHWIKRIGTH